MTGTGRRRVGSRQEAQAGSLSGWLGRARVAVRLARRSTGRARGRSALIVALVALPVAGMAAVTLIIPSMEPTTAELLTVNLGQTQARVTVVAVPDAGLSQDPFGDGWGMSSDSPPAPDAVQREPGTLFPDGTRIIPVLETSATVTTATGVATLSVAEGAPWDPALRGRYNVTAGRVPAAVGEVMVTAATLDRLGIRLGQSTQIVAPVQRTVTVVGLLENRAQPSANQALYGPPGTFTGDTAILTNPQTALYLPDTVLTWDQVTDLNAQGALVVSRDVFENPPAPGTYSFSGGGSSSVGIAFLLAGMVLVFGLVEVMLLAGAAFTVGARAQERSLATVASVGAERRTLFAIVSANGLVLGAIGGVVGVGAGIGVGSLFMRLSDDGGATRYWGYHLWWPAMVGIAALAVLIGWLGALVPAVRAAKLDVVAALRGARRPAAPGPRRPVIGVVIVLAGVALTLAGGAVSVVLVGQGEYRIENLPTVAAMGMLVAGPVITQIGLIFCSGLLLRLLARALSRGGVAARLASRDAARNPGRSVPALAVIMTTVFAVFAMTMLTSTEASNRAAYQYATMPGQVQLRLDYTNPQTGTYEVFPQPDQFAAAVTANLDVATVRTLKSVPDPDSTMQTGGAADDPNVLRPALGIPPANQCPSEPSSVNYAPAAQEPGTDENRAAAEDWRCQNPYVLWGSGGLTGHIWVGDADDLALVLGAQPSPAAREALATGGAVSLYPEYVADGRVSISWWPASAWQNGSPQYDRVPPVRTDTLPAVVQEPEQPIRFGVFVSPDTAAKLGLESRDAMVLATPSTPPTTAQLDALTSSLDTLVGVRNAVYVSVENGPASVATAGSWGILALSGLIAIGAAAVAIGLARADGRRDEATLAAIGSSPRLRRGFGFWQAIVLAGIGAVLGTAVGLVPAVALTLPGAQLDFSAPWLPIAAAAVLMPLLIACGSWLIAGRRNLQPRRAAIE